MSLRDIRNLDYTVILCDRMAETRAFYRDVMRFPVETDRETWVDFRIGASFLALRPRGIWPVCDDGPIPPNRHPSSSPSACRRPCSIAVMRN